jgi:hypothetical protein
MESVRSESKAGTVTEVIAVRVRAILGLVRPAYIPTVLSNCLAGWWLGGGHNSEILLIVLGGSMLVYVGGALLHDAFNVSFDRHHRREWANASSGIRLRLVWRTGLLLLLTGTLVLQVPGRVTGALAMALAVAIVAQNSSHRLLPFFPAFAGLCRLLLYLLGASVAARSITGAAIWCGVACALYSGGLRSLTMYPHRKEHLWWQILLLLSPLALAIAMNTGPYIASLAGLGWLVLLWTMFTGWLVLSKSPRAATLAIPGIALVDMLAACPAPPSSWTANLSEQRHMAMLFLAMFGTSLLLGLVRSRLEQKRDQVAKPDTSTVPALPG